MKHQKPRHVDPWEQMEKTGFFSGKQSAGLWNSINKFKEHFNFGDGSVHALAWEALYTIGCRLQDFESFVRRRLKELEPKSATTIEKVKEGVLSSGDVLRQIYGLTDKEIEALRRSSNRKKKGKK